MQEFLLFLPKIAMICVIFIGVLAVLFGLPGTVGILLFSLIYAIFFEFSPPGSDLRIVLNVALFTALGELLEFLVGTLGGKKFNASNGAIVCSILGGIIGAFIGVPVFLIGSFLGLLLGAFLGALFYELLKKQDPSIALRSALAVFFSRIIATFFKFCIAGGIGIYLLYKLF